MNSEGKRVGKLDDLVQETYRKFHETGRTVICLRRVLSRGTCTEGGCTDAQEWMDPICRNMITGIYVNSSIENAELGGLVA